jgi:hypothetical protein
MEILRAALEPKVYGKRSYLSKVTRGRYGKDYDEELHMLQLLRRALEEMYAVINLILIKPTGQLLEMRANCQVPLM